MSQRTYRLIQWLTMLSLLAITVFIWIATLVMPLAISDTLTSLAKAQGEPQANRAIAACLRTSMNKIAIPVSIVALSALAFNAVTMRLPANVDHTN